ncbi:chemotaxis protein CheA [Candidatus Poribacteria bacterium]|nr:chemotaxis protein CheA [Candidatus Poribacteria bacterium]
MNEEIKRRIEELSEALVLAESSDLQALASLHTRLEEIVQWAQESGHSDIASASAASAGSLESIILDESPDANKSLETVGRTVSAIQDIICHGRPPGEVNLMGASGTHQSTPDSSGETSVSIPETSNRTFHPQPSRPEQIELTVSPAESEDRAAVDKDKTSAATASEAQAAKPKSFEGDTSLLGDFVSEALEHLEAADMNLLTLETEPGDTDSLNAVFRAFHTIKGVAGFLMLDDIGSLAHEAESLLDRARKGQTSLGGSAMDVVFDIVDALRRLVGRLRDSLTTGEALASDDSLPQLLARIRAAASGDLSQPERISAPVATEGLKLGEILVRIGAASQEKVNSALEKQQGTAGGRRLGELLVREGDIAAKDVAHALRAQKSETARQAASLKEMVKIDAERFDRLLDTIGELVIAETMVSQSDELKGAVSSQLARHLSQLDKITRELQEMATSLRMVPIRSTFQKMARLVRDLAKKAGKQVEFVTFGEDTELDKTVVDRIGDPLVHMVRNAVDHGIEASIEERRKAGKRDVGRIELRAFHKGGNIYIEIQDDGRGLDRDEILAKAIERGMAREGESPTERDIFNFIFEPGFSTAKVVTDISGRGVGMDVVRRNIEALRGQVEIRSETGKGSVFIIRMPLTLAIIDGMVVRVGPERYIIPTLSIIRSVRPERSDLSTVLARGEMLSIRGKLIPLFRLSKLFGIDGGEQDPTKGLVVVIEDDGQQAGLLVDGLLGQQQIVIKTLGEAMRGIPGISGGAIMPDGRVGLILDVDGLVRLANSPNGNGAHSAGNESARVTGCRALG